MSIFEIQLCGKDEYAEHYEHGTEPKLVQQTKEIALLERMKSCCVCRPCIGIGPVCMDFVKFELCRSWRPGSESPVSES